MIRKSLLFTSPQNVNIVEENLAAIGPYQLLIKTIYSAISAGTELLVFRGLVPENMVLDESIESLSGSFSYPFKYGYTCVGKVVEVGREINKAWLDKTVFSFHPHEDYFLAAEKELFILPENIKLLQALFLPNMETAVNFLLDGRPNIGQVVCVFGQGVVGLLTTKLLKNFPLAKLYTFDPLQSRRALSKSLGADQSFNPQKTAIEEIKKIINKETSNAPDLLFELSGNPDALNDAIKLAGFSASIIVGSWYGKKQASLELGGDFHRKRVELKSSQVSTIPPYLSGRFSNQRRINITFKHLEGLDTQQFITHQFNFSDIEKAYTQLANKPENTLQVVIKYD